MKKKIKDFEDYEITSEGKIISNKTKTPRILKTWLDKQGYENIKLSKNNARYHFLVHRLVAEAFIPNPDNLPEVNHIDRNRSNNNLENLEWCTRTENLHYSYEVMGPVRNHRVCILKNSISNEIVGEFESVIAAARYANENYGCSISGMQKYYHAGIYQIEFIDLEKDVETKLD